ncbi:M48 family metallopeptidase [Pleionea sediminis]|uniref:M48 family metallopeptidase n=1 Tax=Pleionea sediminis TaxID=2569479 RepID=UPI0011864BFF|nr:M48 family metallopeptidase [Pleionea sediminis]
MNFFEHQQKARKQTKKLVTFFIFAVIGIVALVNFSLFFAVCFFQAQCMPINEYWHHPISISITSVIIGAIGITSLIRWYQLKSGGGIQAVRMANATHVRLDTSNPQEKQFINVVEEMSIASGIIMPSLFVMKHEQSINAFVAGTEPHNAVLVVTQGCLEKLDRQELQGVIAHEFSHIFNGDMKLNIYLIGVLAGILVIGQAGEFLTRTGARSRSSRRTDGRAALIGFALVFAGYIGLFFGRLIKAAISRQREFLADASAVQYTRDNVGISNALYKIQFDSYGSLLESKSAEELSHLCFESSHKIAFFKNILSTHPPIDKRIQQVNPRFTPPKLKPIESKPQPELESENSEEHRKIIDDALSVSSSMVEQSFSSKEICHEVGHINAASIDKAHAQLILLSKKLKLIARGLDNDFAPHHLVYCLIIINNTMPRSEIIEMAFKWMDEKTLNQSINLLPQMAQIEASDQYMLLELAIPRLTNQEDADKKLFLSNCKRLVDIDKNVSLSEYVIYALCIRILEKDTPFKKSITRYQDVYEEITLVLSEFINQTQASNHDKEATLKNLCLTFGIKNANYSKSNFNANQFHKALKKLSRLNPLLKQPVVEAIAHSITSDGQVHKSEFLLIRAVCTYLNTPVPKIF